MDGTGRLFDAFAKALQPTIDPVVVSYPCDAPLDYQELESLVLNRLPSDRPFVLFGESFSGPIAISIAASAPPLLRGLVLCCSFARNPWRWLGTLNAVASIAPLDMVPAGILSRMLLGRFATDTTCLDLSEALKSVSVSAIRARLRAVEHVNVVPLLPRVKVPVLCLRASEDRIVRRSAFELVCRSLPSVRVAEVEGPHFLVQIAPAQAARVTTSFIKETVRL